MTNDVEWNGVHCTCGSGAFEGAAHEKGCAVTLILSITKALREMTADRDVWKEAFESTQRLITYVERAKKHQSNNQ